ncbi:Hypothetical protein D9617_31g064020 [Elsinoe fawcettii]|nr:Hypothetical protein D9617_31g064020 [Elsinoe fawcettii]
MSITTSLGKRKRSAPSSQYAVKKQISSSRKQERDATLPAESEQDSGGDQEPDQQEEDITSIFRRAFEAKFAPLDPSLTIPPHEDTPPPSPSASEASWSGLSRPSSPEQITAPTLPSTAILSGREKRDFMSARPPRSSSPPTAQKGKQKRPPTDEEADEGEKLNLKNDLALQRLLSESHLLSSSGSEAAGKNRLKALELRLQGLGAKESVLAQKDMPLAHRKGIEGKKCRREEERRREAKENGIVLEREKRAKNMERRERGVGGPGVGRFEGGVLRLSKGDVEGIQGKNHGGRGGKRGRGGRGGRGGRRGRR